MKEFLSIQTSHIEGLHELHLRQIEEKIENVMLDANG